MCPQVLLPESPDPVLEAWSTLSVRRHRQQPMNGDDPDGTDFFTLQVQFDSNEGIFTQLHHTANWVITLDPFIGREQIDALIDAPDVITVKPGVGKNQLYTLVVSSTAGRAWVTDRLAKRFKRRSVWNLQDHETSQSESMKSDGRSCQVSCCERLGSVERSKKFSA